MNAEDGRDGRRGRGSRHRQDQRQGRDLRPGRAHCCGSARRPIARCPDRPIRTPTSKRMWAFFIAALSEANRAREIAAIVPTTHACAGALVDEAGLVLPVMDYEFDGLDEIAAAYAAMRPPYSETLSPQLPLGLNQGRQIAWQRRQFPAGLRARQILSGLSPILGLAPDRRRRRGSDADRRPHRSLGRRWRAAVEPGGGARPSAPDAAPAPGL